MLIVYHLNLGIYYLNHGSLKSTPQDFNQFWQTLKVGLDKSYWTSGETKDYGLII